MTGRDDGDVRRDDALRALLAGIDPARPGGPAFAADPTPDDVRERVMAITRNDDTTDDLPDPNGHRHRPMWGRWVVAAAAAVVLVAAGITGALTLGADDTATTTPPTAIAPTAIAPSALALTLPSDDGTVMQSCIAFDVRFLADMPVAFAGTVTSVTDEEVTLDVGRWYQGSTAQQRADVVTLSVPGPTLSISLDGVEFAEGESYLVTANDGTVNGCGFSGPATPELEAAYAEAFGE
jgi:hypothetical protein